MWIFQNKEFTESDIGKHIGFVYLITNKINNRRYVGKKLFWFSKTRTVKGKKKKEKALSDWQYYWSSSDELKADVKKLGEENFIREILYLCANKGTMSYLELREQIDRRVLETDEYYNAFVGGKIHKTHVKL
jgi:predicted  nucleic acid-binding Zn ribbon protein